MNKLLIVLLAVCLVSVHAFVKRDLLQEAQQGVQQGVHQGVQQGAHQEPDTFHKIQEGIETFVENAKEKFSEILDPENVKKGFNQAVDKVHEVASHFVPNHEEHKH